MRVSSRSVSKLLSLLTVLLVSNTITSQAAETTPKASDKATYQTVSFYSEYHDHVVRWPDGKIRVYDKSGFTQWPLIFSRLQPFLGNSTLELADKENDADVVIDHVESLPMPYEHTCGVTQNYIGPDNASIVKSRIKIRRINICIGDSMELGLYMHELGHALGFSRHVKNDDVMGTYENTGKEIHIQTLSAFLTGLYRLPVGAAIPLEASYELYDKPTDWSVSTGKVIEKTSIAAAASPTLVKNGLETAGKQELPLVTKAIKIANQQDVEKKPEQPVAKKTEVKTEPVLVKKPEEKLETTIVAKKQEDSIPADTQAAQDIRKIVPAELTFKQTNPPVAPVSRIVGNIETTDKPKVQVVTVDKKEVEEPTIFVPLGTSGNTKMHQITVIGPNGVETQWVMTNDATSTSPTDASVEKPVSKRKRKRN